VSVVVDLEEEDEVANGVVRGEDELGRPRRRLEKERSGEEEERRKEGRR